MKLISSSFRDGQPIPGDNAFCVPDPENHVAMADNRNPGLEWSDLPPGTSDLRLLTKRQLRVPSARRQVDNQNVKLAPIHLHQHLLQRAHQHRSPPNHGLILGQH